MSKKEDEKDLEMENDTRNDGELLSVQFIFMMFFQSIIILSKFKQNIRIYASLFKSFSTKCRGFSKKDLITLDISFNHYRVVAEELANQEEHEVLGILHDVQGFLKRPEGLPNYISKTDLFLELVKIWKNPSVSPEKKAEAIDTSAHLLKVISGKKSRKKNSHSTIDVSNCLDIVLPPAICQLTSKVS